MYPLRTPSLLKGQSPKGFLFGKDYTLFCNYDSPMLVIGSDIIGIDKHFIFNAKILEAADSDAPICDHPRRDGDNGDWDDINPKFGWVMILFEESHPSPNRNIRLAE
jgi:hypothetical protein